MVSLRQEEPKGTSGSAGRPAPLRARQARAPTACHHGTSASAQALSSTHQDGAARESPPEARGAARGGCSAPVALVPGLVRKGGLSQHTGWRLPVGLPRETRARCAGPCACSSRAIGSPAAAPGERLWMAAAGGGSGQGPGAPGTSRLLQSWLCG